MNDLMKHEWVRFYFSFKGRATRRDFNVRYTLMMLFLSILAAVLDYAVAGGDIMVAAQNSPVSSFFNIIVIWPTLAVIAKRLHDINLSGWWQAAVYAVSTVLFMSTVFQTGVNLVMDPASIGLGTVVMLMSILLFFLVFFIYLSCKRGTPGPNKYGPDPLQVTNDK